MKNYVCPKCGSVDVFLKDSGSQKGLYCSEGCGWIKWVSKKDLLYVEKFIEDNKKSEEEEIRRLDSSNHEELERLKEYINLKKVELEIENNAYNRGILI